MMKQIHLFIYLFFNKIDSQPVLVLAGHSCIEDKRLRKDKGQGLYNVGKNANCLERERVKQIIKFKLNKHSLCL